MRNLLHLAEWELVKMDTRILWPLHTPLLGSVLNRWFAPLLLAGCFLLPANAPAQGTTPAGEGPAAEKVERTPALQFVAAIVFTVVVMLIVCVPSRKG